MSEDKRAANREQGFTFLELLLVLSIVMILTAVILPFSEKRLQRINEEDSLKQFITAVHETQLYAITHQQMMSLYFADNGKTYKAVSNDMVEVLIGEFPDGMRLTKHNHFKRLDFTGTGYLTKTGKMIFSTQSKGQIEVSFQFERGRMLVYE